MRENTRMGSGFLVLPIAMLLVIVGMVVVLGAVGTARDASESSVLPTSMPPTAVAQAVLPTETAPPAAVVEAAAPGAISFDTRVIETGRSLFQTSCAACHASNARGIPGLGKNLVDSDFVRGMSDDELLHFIVVGRAANDPLNTTGIIMPARGANPALSDAQIHDIIVYLRSETQDEFGTAYLEGVDMSAAASVAVEAETAPAPTEDPNFVLPITLLGLDQVAEPDAPPAEAIPAAEGEDAEAYALFCAGCHGIAGEGVEGLGTPLAGSAADDADQLFTYLSAYQPPDPAITGFVHPSPHAFPDLASDEALRALAEYTAALVGG